MYIFHNFLSIFTHSTHFYFILPDLFHITTLAYNIKTHFISHFRCTVVFCLHLFYAAFHMYLMSIFNSRLNISMREITTNHRRDMKQNKGKMLEIKSHLCWESYIIFSVHKCAGEKYLLFTKWWEMRYFCLFLIIWTAYVCSSLCARRSRIYCND